MSRLRGLVTRESILSENALLDHTSRQKLLLIHIVQEDVSFNIKNNVNKETKLDQCKWYTPKHCQAVIDCVAALHLKYYNAGCRPDPPSPQEPSSEPSGTPFRQPDLEEDKKSPDLHTIEQPLNVVETTTDVVISNKTGGNSLCSQSLPPPKKKKRFRTGAYKKHLYCAACGQGLIKIQRRKEQGSDFWVPQEIIFQHKESCNLRPTSIRGIAEYTVDSSVLDAANILLPLATRWYKLVSLEPSNSILFEHVPGDNRFYGLFYHEFAPNVNGLTFMQSLEYINKGINFEELRDFRTFYEQIQPSEEDRKHLMELVILFIEDFKFNKRIHYLFHNRTNFLGAVGFLAGGVKTQKLHCDVFDIPPRSRLPDLPASIVLPIGAKGRSLFFENTTDERSKHHIVRGKAVWFDGNVPHAGAKSKAENPIDNLALHIHIDSTIVFRKPNILLLAPVSELQAWDSDDEEEPGAV